MAKKENGEIVGWYDETSVVCTLNLA